MSQIFKSVMVGILPLAGSGGNCLCTPDLGLLPSRAALAYISLVSHFYRYRRGDRVVIISGRYKGRRGVVESRVYQRTVDRPDGYDAGYHVVLGEGAGGDGAVGSS